MQICLPLTDSQEIKHVMESIGKGEDAQDYGLLFVKFGEGEYLEIWGSSGSVPFLNYHVYQVL